MDFCGLNIVGNICDDVRTELNDMKHKEEQRSYSSSHRPQSRGPDGF